MLAVCERDETRMKVSRCALDVSLETDGLSEPNLMPGVSHLPLSFHNSFIVPCIHSLLLRVVSCVAYVREVLISSRS